MEKDETPRLVRDGDGVRLSGLVHRVREPEGTAPHPTVVMLHGRSGNEDVAWIFGRLVPRNCVIVTPRAPLADPRGGQSWDVRPDRGWPTLDNFDAAVELLDGFLQALPELYGADPERLWLLGFSQGAALAYSHTLRHRAQVRGIAALVGFMPLEAESSPLLRNLRDLPVWMGVGRRDTLVPPEQAVRCGQILVQAGARLDYRTYDTGHKLNAEGSADLQRWMRGVIP
jgi:phospholipase/carboxylesterase